MHLVSSGIEITWQLFVNARISIISTCSRVYREILTMKVLSRVGKHCRQSVSKLRALYAHRDEMINVQVHFINSTYRAFAKFESFRAKQTIIGLAKQPTKFS